jgi:hypothetical protein
MRSILDEDGRQHKVIVAGNVFEAVISTDFLDTPDNLESEESRSPATLPGSVA